MNNCQNCVFFTGDKDKHGTEGWCKRYPPTVFPLMRQGVVGSQPQLMLQMFHPVVKDGAWCGEFHPQEEKLD